jgi:non-heme chloroperoxidase
MTRLDFWARPRGSVSGVDNWWRQGMMGAANAHYLGIKAFSATDQTEDLKAIEVPTLVMQGDNEAS